MKYIKKKLIGTSFFFSHFLSYSSPHSILSLLLQRW